MNTIQSGISIHDPNVKTIDLSTFKSFKVSEAGTELYQRLVDVQEKILENLYTSQPDVSGHPLYKPYATIEVDGKTVATISNSGGVTSSNSSGHKIQKILEQEGDTNLSGPDGAQERAAKIAEQLGGTVEKSSTAITQEEFNANPHPAGTIDYGAMHEDPMYEQLQKTKQARTLFLAQKFAQEDSTTQTTSTENITLQTSKGYLDINIDEYFTPNSGPIDLDSVPLLLFSNNNIDALSAHASERMSEFLKEHNIPSAPETIIYDNRGQIKLPNNYPYAAQFEQALTDDPALARELQTISALASHNIAIQQSINGGGNAKTYTEIALNFSADGALSITANGEAYKGKNKNDNAAQFATKVAEGTKNVANKSETNAIKEFLDYMSKTPEERWFESLLTEEGLTKEEFDALPPEEKLEIEAKIQEKIKESTEQKSKQNAANTAENNNANTTTANVSTTSKNGTTEEIYPLEYYQLPEWYAQYGNELSSQLGEQPKKQSITTDKNKFHEHIRKHYEDTLNEAGISSIEDHYKATILNKKSSEQINHKMLQRINNDPELFNLMDKQPNKT